jgi:hypothetical protein
MGALKTVIERSAGIERFAVAASCEAGIPFVAPLVLRW